MSPRTRSQAFYDGVRASITWLHQEALTMNDPHARAVLNSAAFHLGIAKPNPTDPTRATGSLGVSQDEPEPISPPLRSREGEEGAVSQSQPCAEGTSSLPDTEAAALLDLVDEESLSKDPEGWARHAFRAGWYVNAAVEDQTAAYLAGCEIDDWNAYRYGAVRP